MSSSRAKTRGFKTCELGLPMNSMAPVSDLDPVCAGKRTLSQPPGGTTRQHHVTTLPTRKAAESIEMR